MVNIIKKKIRAIFDKTLLKWLNSRLAAAYFPRTRGLTSKIKLRYHIQNLLYFSLTFCLRTFLYFPFYSRNQIRKIVQFPLENKKCS